MVHRIEDIQIEISLYAKIAYVVEERNLLRKMFFGIGIEPKFFQKLARK